MVSTFTQFKSSYSTKDFNLNQRLMARVVRISVTNHDFASSIPGSCTLEIFLDGLILERIHLDTWEQLGNYLIQKKGSN